MSRLYPCVFCTEDGYCKKYSDEEATSWCVLGPCKDERPSNADRVRAMTDEEIAWWLITGCDGKTCPDYAVEYREDHDDASEGCRMCWLEWLKQECE